MKVDLIPNGVGRWQICSGNGYWNAHIEQETLPVTRKSTIKKKLYFVPNRATEFSSEELAGLAVAMQEIEGK